MDNYIWQFLIFTESMFHCLNIVNMLDVNNADLNDTGIAFLTEDNIRVLSCDTAPNYTLTQTYITLTFSY